MLRRIYPVSPEMFTNTILTNLTIINDCLTQVVDAFTLLAFVWNGKAMANMVIGIKFRAHLPDRVGFNSAVYCVRCHTLPVLRCCTCCLLFGHSKIRCGTCLFCGGNHRPASWQCPAYLQAMQTQLLQHEHHHTISVLKHKLRGIRPGSF